MLTDAREVEQVGARTQLWDHRQRAGGIVAVLLLASLFTDFSVFVAGYHLSDELFFLLLFVGLHLFVLRPIAIDIVRSSRVVGTAVIVLAISSVASDYPVYSAAKSAQFVLGIVAGAILASEYLRHTKAAIQVAAVLVVGLLASAGVGLIDHGFLRIALLYATCLVVLGPNFGTRGRHSRRVPLAQFGAAALVSYLLAAQDTKAIWLAGIVILVAALPMLETHGLRLAVGTAFVLGALGWFYVGTPASWFPDSGDDLAGVTAEVDASDPRRRVQDRLADISSPSTSTSTVHRLVMAATAINAAESEPVTGIGFSALNLTGAFRQYYDERLFASFIERTNPEGIPDLTEVASAQGRSPGAHNLYLDVAAGTGAIGVLSLLLYLGAAWKSHRSSLWVVFGASFLVAGLAWQYLAVAFGAVVLGALGWPLMVRAGPRERGAQGPPSATVSWRTLRSPPRSEVRDPSDNSRSS